MGHHGEGGDCARGSRGIDGIDGAVRLHLVSFPVNDDHLPYHVSESTEAMVAVKKKCRYGETGDAIKERGDYGILVQFVWRHAFKWSEQHRFQNSNNTKRRRSTVVDVKMLH